jgi:hypothetical protein
MTCSLFLGLYHEEYMKWKEVLLYTIQNYKPVTKFWGSILFQLSLLSMDTVWLLHFVEQRLYTMQHLLDLSTAICRTAGIQYYFAWGFYFNNLGTKHTPLRNSRSTQLSHKAWPQMFTISFNEGFLYFVVLHRGHTCSSILQLWRK